MTLEAMYQEEILDHYRHPRNYGKISNPAIEVHESNPLCGDVIDICMQIDESKTIKQITFAGNGCAISQAAASMLTEHLTGKKIEELIGMKKEAVFEMLGIPLSPIRVKCALLAFKAAKVGAVNYLTRKT